LRRTDNKEEYEEAITVVGLRHKYRQREIEYKTKIDKAQGKNDKGRGKNSSKPQSSNHTSDRKKPYDKG
jgi:hypothetical protein